MANGGEAAPRLTAAGGCATTGDVEPRLPMKSSRLFSASLFACLLPFALAAAESKPLFDGKTLAGWEGDLKHWRAEGGMIVGGSLQEKMAKNVFLATTKSFQNFELRLKIKIEGSDGMLNSGIQIRSVRVPNSTEMAGYQVDAGEGWWGKLYDESRRRKVIGQAADLAAVTAVVKKTDWNEMRIRVEGPRIRSWVNGVPALDYTEQEPNIAQDGSIGLQVHSGGKVQVSFKDLTIEELPASDGPTWDKVGRPTKLEPPAKKAKKA